MRNLILMPFAHIAIAMVVSQVLVAQEAMVDKSHLSTEKKCTGTERVKYHRPGKETGNKIQSTVAKKMETFGLNVISSQA